MPRKLGSDSKAEKKQKAVFSRERHGNLLSCVPHSEAEQGQHSITFNLRSADGVSPELALVSKQTIVTKVLGEAELQVSK